MIRYNSAIAGCNLKLAVFSFGNFFNLMILGTHGVHRDISYDCKCSRLGRQRHRLSRAVKNIDPFADLQIRRITRLLMTAVNPDGFIRNMDNQIARTL